MNIETLGMLANAVNKLVNSANTLNDPSSSGMRDIAAITGEISAAANLITTLTPAGSVAAVSALVNGINLPIQVELLNEAIASGNTEAIISSSLDTAAAVAGVVGSIPSPIAPEARAIALSISAASSLYKNRDAIGAGISEVATSVDEWATGLLNDLGNSFLNFFLPKDKRPINIGTSTFFTAAGRALPRRDPLTFDLDGDGLETIGTAAGILFDHNGDGIKSGTGWVKPDDGFLVLDRNGNGLIDSGRELFGDSTLKSNGQTAIDGFDALKDLDSNGDGQISAADSQFANLRLWRDLNQDGISQSGELASLASLGIASLTVAKTANSQLLADGNQIADLGTYTRTDGSTGTTGEVGTLGDINLVSDTFHRTFPDTLDTSAVASRPDRQGSGLVRDLQEAANKGNWKAVA